MLNLKKRKREEDDCDRRTVFAQKISLRANEKDVKDFFSPECKVRHVYLSVDSAGYSKGFGHIEFDLEESVLKAIDLCAKKTLHGELMMVKPSMVEQPSQYTTNEYPHRDKIVPFHGGTKKLYLGNLPTNINVKDLEVEIRRVFKKFGSLLLVELPEDVRLNSKGFGFVQFTDEIVAKGALSSCGGLKIAGLQLSLAPMSSYSV